jgi:hypothetical protein
VKFSDGSKPFVVFVVRANPFPNKKFAGKFSNRTVMSTNAKRPIRFADGFEMQ